MKLIGSKNSHSRHKKCLASKQLLQKTLLDNLVPHVHLKVTGYLHNFKVETSHHRYILFQTEEFNKVGNTMKSFKTPIKCLLYEKPMQQDCCFPNSLCFSFPLNFLATFKHIRDLHTWQWCGNHFKKRMDNSCQCDRIF